MEWSVTIRSHLESKKDYITLHFPVVSSYLTKFLIVFSGHQGRRILWDVLSVDIPVPVLDVPAVPLKSPLLALLSYGKETSPNPASLSAIPDLGLLEPEGVACKCRVPVILGA